MHQSTQLNFDQLKDRTSLTAAMLIATLQEYGSAGQSLDAEIVKRLITRTNPTMLELDALRAGASDGLHHPRWNQGMDAGDFVIRASYAAVVEYIDRLKQTKAAHLLQDICIPPGFKISA